MKPAATDHCHPSHFPLSPPTKNSPEAMAGIVPFGYHFQMTATGIQALLHHLLVTGGNTARDIPPQMRYEKIYGRHPRDLLVDGSPCWFFSSTLQKSFKGNSITHHRRIAEGGQWRRTSKMQVVWTSEGKKIGELRKFEFRIKNSPHDKEWIKSEFLATEYRAWFSSSARLSTVALYYVYTTPRRHKHLHVPPVAASDDAIPVVVTADPDDAVPVVVLSAPPVTADQQPTSPSQFYAAECFTSDNPEWCFSPGEHLSDPHGPAVPDHEPIPAADEQTLASGSIVVDTLALPEEPISATQDQVFDSGDLVAAAAADVSVWATTDQTLDNDQYLLDNGYPLLHGYSLLEENQMPTCQDSEPLFPSADQFPTDQMPINYNDALYYVDPMMGSPAPILTDPLLGDEELWEPPMQYSLGRRYADTTANEDAQGTGKRSRLC